MREQLRTSSPLRRSGPIDTIGQDRIGWSVLASPVVCVSFPFGCEVGVRAGSLSHGNLKELRNFF